jgi:hypothetical protein
MPVDQRRVIDAAMELRGAAPDQWREFCMAVNGYAAATTVEMVRSPPDLILRAQGMALGVHELASILNDAPKLKEQHMEAQARQARKTSGRTHDVTNGRDPVQY